MEKAEIKTEGYELREKVVKPAGSSGLIYLPKLWVNKKVKIILVDEIKNEELIK